MRDMDWDTASALQGWFYATRWGRLPPAGSRARLRVVFRFARLALLARCHDGPWWALDDWHPRCDPRIPLSAREPQANYGAPRARSPSPGCGRRSSGIWAPCWRPARCAGPPSARSGCRVCCASTAGWRPWTAPATSWATRRRAAGQAAAFRRWDADPANRHERRPDRRPAVVAPRLINDDLRAVAELFAFLAANPVEARRLHRPVTGPAAHRRARGRLAPPGLPHPAPARSSTTEHYVDDHALAQIPAALPLLGPPREQQMHGHPRRRHPELAQACDDPQAMRMILLQILTGRRASEIRTCAFDCLSPLPDRVAVEAAEGRADRALPLRPNQDRRAPDTILVDRKLSTVIEEQQQGVRERFPDIVPRFLFPRRLGNRTAISPTSRAPTPRSLLRFSELIASHRRQRTRHPPQPHAPIPAHPLTRLAELGLPVHVLQRYAGHANPTMSMHYVAQREEHAEQAFLATRKFKADGTARCRSPARTTTACTCSTGPTGSCRTASACCHRCRPATRATPA